MPKNKSPGWYFVVVKVWDGGEEVEKLTIILVMPPQKDGKMWAQWWDSENICPLWVAEKHIVKWVQKIKLPKGFEYPGWKGEV